MNSTKSEEIQQSTRVDDDGCKCGGSVTVTARSDQEGGNILMATTNGGGAFALKGAGGGKGG